MLREAPADRLTEPAERVPEEAAREVPTEREAPVARVPAVRVAAETPEEEERLKDEERDEEAVLEAEEVRTELLREVLLPFLETEEERLTLEERVMPERPVPAPPRMAKLPSL